MKAFVFGDAEIILMDNRIGWQPHSGQPSRFWVSIESQWYQARTEIEIDRPQLEVFYDQLQ